ncbi:hypothetical protein K1719_002611 [Acacia pycnantha]|nr:hypothetical protein K1719_002611 [Acacia pycnantha]
MPEKPGRSSAYKFRNSVVLRGKPVLASIHVLTWEELLYVSVQRMILLFHILLFRSRSMLSSKDWMIFRWTTVLTTAHHLIHPQRSF